MNWFKKLYDGYVEKKAVKAVDKLNRTTEEFMATSPAFLKSWQEAVQAVDIYNKGCKSPKDLQALFRVLFISIQRCHSGLLNFVGTTDIMFCLYEDTVKCHMYEKICDLLYSEEPPKSDKAVSIK